MEHVVHVLTYAMNAQDQLQMIVSNAIPDIILKEVLKNV